jgi:hypothetical protein
VVYRAAPANVITDAVLLCRRRRTLAAGCRWRGLPAQSRRGLPELGAGSCVVRLEGCFWAGRIVACLCLGLYGPRSSDVRPTDGSLWASDRQPVVSLHEGCPLSATKAHACDGV